MSTSLKEIQYIADLNEYIADLVIMEEISTDPVGLLPWFPDPGLRAWDETESVYACMHACMQKEGNR
jgi:hypothetical protein